MYFAVLTLYGDVSTLKPSSSVVQLTVLVYKYNTIKKFETFYFELKSL